MNDKITFPRLAALLADRSGRSKRFSEDFLREFFALISERLEDGESVKVKGLGTFRLSRVEPRKSVDVTTGQPMEISGHSKVVFVPAKELAEAVNAPFEAFTAVEISDEADLGAIFTQEEMEMLPQPEDQPTDTDSEEAAEVENQPSMKDPVAVPEAHGSEDKNDSDPDATKSDFQPVYKDNEAEERKNSDETEQSEDSGETEKSEGLGGTEDTKAADEMTETENPDNNEDTSGNNDTEETDADSDSNIEELDEGYDQQPNSWRKNWMRTLLILLGAAVFALIATFTIWYVFATHDFNKAFKHTAANEQPSPTQGFVVGKALEQTEKGSAPQTNATDSATDYISDTALTQEEPEVPTAPSDPVVYDTISTTRYLTTMAKVHYGNYNLWPYIYQENSSFLGHPDRIRPGTPVVIPKLSKYGVDPNNSEHIEKAKKLGTEIYARFGKKI